MHMLVALVGLELTSFLLRVYRGQGTFLAGLHRQRFILVGNQNWLLVSQVLIMSRYKRREVRGDRLAYL